MFMKMSSMSQCLLNIPGPCCSYRVSLIFLKLVIHFKLSKGAGEFMVKFRRLV